MPKMPPFVESPVGEAKVRDYTAKILKSFSDHLITIHQQNKSLTQNDILILLNAYTLSEDEAFRALYSTAWKNFHKTMFFSYFDTKKYDILDRLFELQLQHLLVDAKTEPVPGEKIPDYVSVGLLAGIRFLVGADNYGRLETEAVQLAQSLEHLNRGAILWEIVIESKEIEIIYFNAIMYLLQNFTEFERRFVWMQNMIDSNRPPIQSGGFPWVMSRLDFCVLVDAILLPLRTAFNARLELDRLRSAYGYANISKIQGIIAEFDKFYYDFKKPA